MDIFELLFSWNALAVYVVGAFIATGITGGVRDGMEGIADEFYIFLWPLALSGWVLFSLAGALIQIGCFIRLEATSGRRQGSNPAPPDISKKPPPPPPPPKRSIREGDRQSKQKN